MYLHIDGKRFKQPSVVNVFINRSLDLLSSRSLPATFQTGKKTPITMKSHDVPSPFDSRCNAFIR